MAVRDWHAGQLAVAWIAALILAWLFYTFARGDSFDGRVHTVGWIIVFLPVAVMLAVTWKWFGSRAGDG